MVRQVNRSLLQLRQPFFVFFVSLAAFGLIYRLVEDPVGLASNAVLLVLVLAAFYGIYRYIYRKGKPTHHHHPPVSRPSVKNRHNLDIPTLSGKRAAINRKPRQKRKDYPFKVIEGNKGKKKRPFSS